MALMRLGSYSPSMYRKSVVDNLVVTGGNNQNQQSGFNRVRSELANQDLPMINILSRSKTQVKNNQIFNDNLEDLESVIQNSTAIRTPDLQSNDLIGLKTGTIESEKVNNMACGKESMVYPKTTDKRLDNVTNMIN